MMNLARLKPTTAMCAGLLLALALTGCGELEEIGGSGAGGGTGGTSGGTTGGTTSGSGTGSSGTGGTTTTTSGGGTTTTGGSGGTTTGGGTGAGADGWNQIESPARKADITSVYFYDDKHGWMGTTGDKMVAERGAWFTSNGGQSWEWRRREYDAYVVKHDANGERVWMGGSDRRELWYTDDNKDFKPMEGGLEQQDWISDLYFWDKKEGLVVSQTGDRIHRTADGGETFKQYEFGREVAPGINDLEVLGDEVWAASGPDFNNDGTGGHILYSSDRGKNWETIKLEDKAHRYKGGSIQAVHAISSQVIWAAGVNRQLYVTRDGMETWTQIEGVPPEFHSFADIDGEGDHIVTGGNSEGGVFIWESTDGGKNWKSTFANDQCGSGCEIDGIEYVNSELAYAYGYGNTLIRFSGR